MKFETMTGYQTLMHGVKFNAARDSGGALRPARDAEN